MKTWESLSQEEKNEVVCKAREFERSHEEYVVNQLGMSDYSYPPSGSDLWHPELWKASHWQWFTTGDCGPKLNEVWVPKLEPSIWDRFIGLFK